MDLTHIRLLILDVDGVMTDGRIVTGPEGESTKRFFVQDGCAIKLWQRSGGVTAILSGRGCDAVGHRAAELGIAHVQMGVSDKLAGLGLILEAAGKDHASAAYVGDDLPDVGPMERCAFPVAVANAVGPVKRASRYVTRRPGGSGAVAEVIELILRKQQRWSPEAPANG